MDWHKFWSLFHKVWGHCHESPEYDKKYGMRCRICYMSR